MNGLTRRGAEVIHSGVAYVHESGHAKQGELQTLLALARPEYFIPVHGEYRHLLRHARLAIEMGARLEDIAGTIHAHPTLSEAVGEAAHAVFGHAIHI